MSTNITPDDPRKVGPDPETAVSEEPLLVEAVDDAPSRPAPRRPPPPLPHPGFWWALGWCVLVLIVAQIVGLAVALVIVLVQAIRLGGLNEAMTWVTDNLSEPALIVPLQMAAHVTIFATALLALRLMAGRSWRRQIAIRLPTATHVLLVCLGAPAFWVLAGGLQMIAARVLPSLDDLPSLVLVGVLLMLLVGGFWLAFQGATGKDGVRELARSPIHVQLAVGVFGLMLVLAVGILLYHFISPPMFRLPKVNNDLLNKSIENLLDVPWWAGLLIVAVTPAFSEEFWCRAFLGRGLVGRHGFVMGIIYTSCFFGALHGFPHQAAMAIIMGIVLHSAYIASRSLLIAMLMHYLNNSFSVLSYKFSGSLGSRLQAVEMDPQQIPWPWFAAAAALGVAVLWAFYTSRARLVRTDGSGEPPWQPPYPSVALPPSNSGTEVVSPWPGWLPTLAVIAAAAGFGYMLYAV